jgi:hypothetical protein
VLAYATIIRDWLIEFMALDTSNPKNCFGHEHIFHVSQAIGVWPRGELGLGGPPRSSTGQPSFHFFANLSAPFASVSREKLRGCLKRLSG